MRPDETLEQTLYKPYDPAHVEPTTIPQSVTDCLVLRTTGHHNYKKVSQHGLPDGVTVVTEKCQRCYLLRHSKYPKKGSRPHRTYSYVATRAGRPVPPSARHSARAYR